MTIRRILAVCIPVVCCLGFLIVWRLDLYSGGNFLKGQSVFLIPDLRNDFILHSRLVEPLRKVQREPLKNGWQQLVHFGPVIDSTVQDVQQGQITLPIP